MTAFAALVTVPLQNALRDDSALAAIVGPDPAANPPRVGEGVYDTLAPADAPLPYVTIGSIPELDIPVYGGALSSMPGTLDLWSGEMTKREIVELLWPEVKRILETGIAIPGAFVSFDDVSLIDVRPDEDGQAMHGIVRFTITAEEP